MTTVRVKVPADEETDAADVSVTHAAFPVTCANDLPCKVFRRSASTGDTDASQPLYFEVKRLAAMLEANHPCPPDVDLDTWIDQELTVVRRSHLRRKTLIQVRIPAKMNTDSGRT